MKKKYRKLRLLAFIIIILIVSIISICFKSVKCNDYTEETYSMIEEKTFEFSNNDTSVEIEQTQKVETDYVKLKDKTSIDLDSDEAYLLAKIAMAEAEGESTKGKALVMLVVLNRVLDDNFPDTIGEVIFQHNGDNYQFSPVKSGRFYENEPNEDCWKALDLMYSGWDESQGALYFESSKNDTWHNRNLELLFEEGGHQFYK